ncbi:MAG: DNA-3-methyladenine glycosylase I [Acidobacteria bacterium]|nr:DNA-3-methyladenine glycosylase I [Acidobacteriota bacterium]
MKAPTRCAWASDDPLYQAYHDEEWGVPLHDDQRFFEFLLLEGAQAGLAWITILRKREGYRRAFASFDPAKVARFDRSHQTRLMQDESIIRNRLKIGAAVDNARAFLDVQAEHGSFDHYIWQFVNRRTKQNQWTDLTQVPTETVQSQAMSKDLKQRGFRFVGPTICYAFMQATGMVNDHVASCFRHLPLARASH